MQSMLLTPDDFLEQSFRLSGLLLPRIQAHSGEGGGCQGFEDDPRPKALLVHATTTYLMLFPIRTSIISSLLSNHICLFLAGLAS